MNGINVPPSISDKSPTFKKHALRHINKLSNGSTPSLIHQEIPRPQRVTKRKSYHLPSRDSSFENEKSTVFPLVSKRRLSDVIQTPTKAGIRRGKISLLTPPSSSQKPKLPHRFHNPSQIFKLVFRAFCDKSQDINSSTCIRADSFMNSIIPPPISSKSPTFKKHALRHINKVPNGTTSFVSVTPKLLGAFHRAFKMFTNPSIAVIDLELAGRLRNTQKDSHPVAHSVKSLKLESPDNYRGNSNPIPRRAHWEHLYYVMGVSPSYSPTGALPLGKPLLFSGCFPSYRCSRLGIDPDRGRCQAIPRKRIGEISII